MGKRVGEGGVGERGLARGIYRGGRENLEGGEGGSNGVGKSVDALTRIRLMAVIMSTLHVGLLISRLPMNCV